MKITLVSGESRINTTCNGTSQHIHNRRVVHGLSAKGCYWLESLPEGHAPVETITKHGECRLGYTTEEQLP